MGSVVLADRDAEPAFSVYFTFQGLLRLVGGKMQVCDMPAKVLQLQFRGVPTGGV
jgi:hypothetical protein